MISLFLKLLLSYLLGSVSGSMVVGKFRNVDIRKMGSGNAGGTNAFRTQGAVFAIGVLVIDIFKGFVATFYIPYFNIIGRVENVLPLDLLIVLCGMAAVLGHVYPVYFGFKGGKGAGAAIGMILAIAPLLILIAIIIWGIVLVSTGYVGLGTMAAAVSVPVFTVFLEVKNDYFLYISIFLAIFIIFAHRSNIKRMLNGNENRFDKARIFHRSKNS